MLNPFSRRETGELSCIVRHREHIEEGNFSDTCMLLDKRQCNLQA